MRKYSRSNRKRWRGILKQFCHFLFDAKVDVKHLEMSRESYLNLRVQPRRGIDLF